MSRIELKPKRALPLLAAVAAAAAIAACGSTSSGAGASASAAAPSAAAPTATTANSHAARAHRRHHAKSRNSGSVTIGELFPYTGSKALLSSWGTHGVNPAVYDINKHGGVDGGLKLKTVSADDAADSVDTLPALRKLFLSHPVAVIGPWSPTIEAVVHQFQPNNVVDMALGGTSQLDDMNFPYVFRTFASDSTEATAMAIQAIKKGHKTASLIFDNSANSQGFIPPLTKAYKRLGGKVLSVQSVVPDQGSYRSELVTAFAKHPQIVFASFDTQTASTMWADAAQLGYLNVPWQGDDLMSGAAYAQAFGSNAPGHLFAALPAAPTGAAYNHFLNDYKAVYHTKTILPATYSVYDAVVIAALAMDEAHSTNPKVWHSDVMKVSDPPGTQCTDYAACARLIAKHKKINYQGAGGNNDFNKHHNVFSGFAIMGYKSGSNNPVQVSFVGAKAISKITR